ncbi:MAG: DegT/DnrJ/EryC1/StrS aminotransferase family protein [Verrucomicrobia bacterium]|nr:DegT/DnrJ/EryC1/StrS aminotransferase family protein [Verrucomicrobiota bacterium]
MRFPVYRPLLGELEKKYVNECLDSTWISSKGSFIESFEKKFAEYIGVEYSTSVCNGTVALHLALLAMGIMPGDEVIVPTLTYVASANTIVQAGGKPIFVDSLSSTWQMDPKDIERKLTPRTKAIMAVHLYGHPCDMKPILDICRKHNLLLIEDCAEAIGTYYEGIHVGGFGDIATFSFFGNKTITTGEGGMVVSKHENFLKRAYRLKTQGVSLEKHYWHDIIAYNYRMTNICAAIGVAQLGKVEEILAKKRKIAQWYEKQLSGLPLTTDREIGNVKHSFWMCSILLENGEQRTPLRDYLMECGIETRPFFYPVHQMPMYNSDDSLPTAESLSKRGINLPSYPSLSEEDVSEITQSIRSFFSASTLS